MKPIALVLMVLAFSRAETEIYSTTSEDYIAEFSGSTNDLMQCFDCDVHPDAEVDRVWPESSDPSALSVSAP